MDLSSLLQNLTLAIKTSPSFSRVKSHDNSVLPLHACHPPHANCLSRTSSPYSWPHNKWHLPLFILFNIKWRGAKDWHHLLPQNAIFALTIRKVWFLRPIMCICNVFIFASQECCEVARFACTGICLLEKDWSKKAAKPLARFSKVFEKNL
jgi:hypothetical protein